MATAYSCRMNLSILSPVIAILVMSISFEMHAQDHGGEVRGKITVSAADEITNELFTGRTLAHYKMHIHDTSDPPPPYRLSEISVVYIESVPHTSEPQNASSAHPQLNQSQMLFRPLLLPVLVGTTVSFPNNDDLFHNVFSYSQPMEFDLGRYPRGQTRYVRFDKPGVVKVYCDIHSYMYATILVLDNPFFAVPDDDGNFVIKNIPAGTYKIVFWYGRKKSGTKIVTVEDGKISTVNFEN